jgi:hypothetical protein
VSKEYAARSISGFLVAKGTVNWNPNLRRTGDVSGIAAEHPVRQE